MIKKIGLYLVSLGIALVCCGKSYAFMQDYETDKVRVSLFTSFNKINPKQNLDVLVKFEMKNGWHIFAQNPGDIGLPTLVGWQLPKGFELGSVEWSRYQKFDNDGIIQYGYAGTAYYKTVIKPGSDMSGQARFKGKITWLACQEECVPEKFLFDFSLPMTNQVQTIDGDYAKTAATAEKMFVKTSGNPQNQSLWGILLMAFIGGIILNFMPCIFPILTIKAISLAQGTVNKTKSRIEALIYMGGVVASFLLIATLLVWLRSTGEQIGWGFQLQSPLFVIVMIVIFFIIFLMLLDVVNVRNPFANRVGRISFARRKVNAFFTGFFAVLIASPCTAPFMGIAIGYTLSQPIYVYYPVFFALSVGYALPFTLVSMFPKAVHKILPKPGRWMEVLKKIFAIPVFLTCVWLVWVLCNQMHAQPEKDVNSLHWEKFEAQKVNMLVQNNRPVFIDFTAKWCITCLMNKRLSLESQTFADLVKDNNIALFEADWTNYDEDISKALEAYGRNSIPLYIYYNGSNGEYKILPQLLTPAILKEELK